MSKKQFTNGVYYSTNFALEINEDENTQKSIDFLKEVIISVRKIKNNKLITCISNIDSSMEDLERIAKIVKCNCGAGGTIKDGEILIQGDFHEKVYNVIKKLGFDNIKN